MNQAIIENKKIFIAGATGLVGSGILQYLLENYPSTYIKGTYFQTPPFIKHEHIEYVQADLTNRDECRKAVRGCDYAIMAAANTGGAAVAKSEPHRLLMDSLLMDLLMLEAFALEGIQRVVFISSTNIYQEFDGYLRENDVNWNIDPHPAYLGIGWAMRALEKMCQFWYEKKSLEAVIVRAGNMYGPYDKFDPSRSNVIPALIRKAVDQVEPFVVWGQPSVGRDVIYIEDAARAIVSLLNKKEIKFDIFNLGSGITTTVDEIVRFALKSANFTPQEVTFDTSKPTTIKFRGIDCNKIKTILNWQPRYSAEEGIEKTTKWWMENMSWWRK